MAAEIEFSKSGMKISYLRYIADSSAGFISILCVLFLVSKGYQIPFFGHSLESVMKLSGQTPLFIYIIIFLLATPIGLFMNVFSWFILGWCRIYLVRFWFTFSEKKYSPFFATKKAFHFDELAIFFIVDRAYEVHGRGIYETSKLFRDYLGLFFREKIRIEHIKGLIGFLRNMSLFSLFSFLYAMCYLPEVQCLPGIPCVFLLFSIFFTLVSSLTESYLCLHTLSTFYLLCIARGISNEDGASPQELIRKIHAAYFSDNSGTASLSNS